MPPRGDADYVHLPDREVGGQPGCALRGEGDPRRGGGHTHDRIWDIGFMRLKLI